MNSHENDMFCQQIKIYHIMMASICDTVSLYNMLIFLTDYVYFQTYVTHTPTAFEHLPLTPTG